MFEKINKIQEIYSGMKVIDLSPKLERGIPRWPTHPHLVIDQTVYHSKDGYYCQTLNMGEHVGCHVDAPYHVNEELPEKTIEKYSPDVLTGRAVVYDFYDMELEPGQQVDIEDFREQDEKTGITPDKGDIVLINFGWNQRYWKLDKDGYYYATQSPGLTENVTRHLYETGIKAVGCDNIACDQAVKDGVSSYASGHAKYFLPKDILIMEMLSNINLLPRVCFFIAVPLNIQNGSGSPIRPYALVE